ncbi:hypothetical protein GQ457_01G018420 [Hibiscus cannabinus]
MTYGGKNEVKETKIELLNLNYKNFKMDLDEDIKAMFDPFSIIVNELKGFREPIPKDKPVRKLIYSLPDSWYSKKTTIIEEKSLKELKLDVLKGSLFTPEMMMSKGKKIEEKVIVNMNVALKSSTSQQEDSSGEE